MSRIIRMTLAPAFLLAAAHAQDFEVVSIKASEPRSGFHFAADTASGGPGTADPGLFRCSDCSLATLIVKAFNLQPYQFPGRTALTGNTYEVVAKVPGGATAEEFSAMLQNLLKSRFGLVFRFQEKQMKGYHLVVSKDGPKLKDSTAAAVPPNPDSHRPAQAEAHSHSGAIVFGAFATYRAANQSAADLARVLSDQIGLPVDDKTGLTGKYDIALRWSGDGSAHSGDHAGGAWPGGGGYAGHDGGSAGASDPAAAPTIFDALQQQLGLKLVPGEQTSARLFIVDRIAQRPTEN